LISASATKTRVVIAELAESRIAAEFFAAAAWSIELTTTTIQFAPHPVQIADNSGAGEIRFPQLLLDAILAQLKTQ